MASVFHVLSADTTVINGLTNTNAVKSIGQNPGNNLQLCAYENQYFANFGDYKADTQALENPGGALLYALMPFDIYAVSQYSVTLANAWSVPNLAGETLSSPGTTFGTINELAQALSAIGGLLMSSNGSVLNS
jgi:hypothetical protein